MSLNPVIGLSFRDLVFPQCRSCISEGGVDVYLRLLSDCCLKLGFMCNCKTHVRIWIRPIVVVFQKHPDMDILHRPVLCSRAVSCAVGSSTSLRAFSTPMLHLLFLGTL